MNKGSRHWEVLKKTPKNHEFEASEVIKILLKNRGIETPKERQEFLYPTHPDDIDSSKIGIRESTINTAVGRIKEAIKRNETIVVYGDYDVDGICGTGILFETLYLLTKEVHPHLPGRFDEGYGLNPESVVSLKEKYPDLGVIITVDNGIKAYKGIKKAKELGIDVIVTDHHDEGKENPNSFTSVYTKEIGGAEIAWIFAREIRKKFFGKSLKLKFGDGLDLAALGTIADMMPLLGANRSFAWHGLRTLRRTRRPGLLALYGQAGIDQEEIGVYEVGYLISPRLNAAGRLETALEALRLICTGNNERARELAYSLGRMNSRRQGIQEEMVIHAKNLLGQETKENVIVLAEESYHEGVVGLVAAKLVEEYGKPAIVLTKGSIHSKGSARSIPGYDLKEALSKVESLLISWGGHSAAAGLTLETEKIAVFRRELNLVSAPLLTKVEAGGRLKIDMELPFSIIDDKLWSALQEFEPTGMGNPSPVFSSKNVRILSGRTVGHDEKHIKLKLQQGGINFGAIGFGLSKFLPKILPDQKIDIAFNITKSKWNGNETLELKLKDIKIPS